MKKKISSLRNLGPMAEADFKAAGIHYAEEIIMLGPKKAFLRWLSGRKILGKSISCYNACYLYALYGAIHDCDWHEVPDDVKEDFKQYTAELRANNS